MRCLRTILLSVAPLFAVALLVCCENETTSNLQAQRMELVNMITDSAGNCSLMALDNGDTLMLSKPLGDFRCDTVARYMVVYTTRKSVPYTTAVENDCEQRCKKQCHHVLMIHVLGLLKQ